MKNEHIKNGREWGNLVFKIRRVLPKEILALLLRKDILQGIILQGLFHGKMYLVPDFSLLAELIYELKFYIQFVLFTQIISREPHRQVEYRVGVEPNAKEHPYNCEYPFN